MLDLILCTVDSVTTLFPAFFVPVFVLGAFALVVRVCRGSF